MSCAPAASRIVAEDRLGVVHVELVVLAARVGEMRDRHAVGVLLVGERHAVLGLRQQLVEHADRRPVVVVAHVLAQRAPAVALGDHVLGPSDRQRRDRLDREAAGEAARLVGLVELLGGDLRRRRLVHPLFLGEASRALRGALHHHVAPDLVLVVAEAVREARETRVQAAAAASRSSSRRRRPRAARWKRSSSSPSRM